MRPRTPTRDDPQQEGPSCTKCEGEKVGIDVLPTCLLFSVSVFFFLLPVGYLSKLENSILIFLVF